MALLRHILGASTAKVSYTMSQLANEISESDHRNLPLREILLRHCEEDGVFPSAIPGLRLFRGSSMEAAHCTIYEPVFAVMAQGAKRVWNGDKVFQYDARHYLLSSVQVPMFAQVTQASEAEPYIGVGLALDAMKIAELDQQIQAVQRDDTGGLGMAVGELSDAIRDALLRLVSLLDTPEAIPVLAPLREQELLFHLLCSPVGSRLREVMKAGSHSHQIASVLQWIKSNLTINVSVEEMAELANMSKSSFHQHFKNLTSMTPLQYQKQLRLQEARRIMLSQQADAASAAYAVGYESPSQFSREYRRLFGESPARDVAMMSVG